jgi:16S rRNA (cytidine1402-2'-O)-methyltransferase
MPLYLVATPIGNPQDISLRALEILKRVETIIVEERKEGTKFLREHGISGRNYVQLNEHSTPEDIQNLLGLCQAQEVALITDCGTPGFCDPGADLVRACRQQKVDVITLPGASSLMGLLSLSSQRINQFVFRGFISQETSQREVELRELQKEKRAFVIMDTPYRLQKMLDEVKRSFPERRVLIVTDLTQPTEKIWENWGRQIDLEQFPKKAEFMMLVYAAT